MIYLFVVVLFVFYCYGTLLEHDFWMVKVFCL